jgi:hypothetical protein
MPQSLSEFMSDPNIEYGSVPKLETTGMTAIDKVQRAKDLWEEVTDELGSCFNCDETCSCEIANILDHKLNALSGS